MLMMIPLDFLWRKETRRVLFNCFCFDWSTLTYLVENKWRRTITIKIIFFISSWDGDQNRNNPINILRHLKKSCGPTTSSQQKRTIHLWINPSLYLSLPWVEYKFQVDLSRTSFKDRKRKSKRSQWCWWLSWSSCSFQPQPQAVKWEEWMVLTSLVKMSVMSWYWWCRSDKKD